MQRLSLRWRLCLLMAGMLATALGISLIAMTVFARSQLVAETEPTIELARQTALAMNRSLETSTEPQRALDAFVKSLETDKVDTLVFEPAGSSHDPLKNQRDKLLHAYPGWFLSLIVPDLLTGRFPIHVAGQHVGDLVFTPDLSFDVHEKWISLLAVLLTGTVLSIASFIGAYYIVGATLRPLGNLRHGLTRLQAGDYGVLIPSEGPPEIRRSCSELNQLAHTLADFRQENNALLRRMVSIQDTERKDLARELHDEMGPLLFAIRASVSALLSQPRTGAAETAAQRLTDVVQKLQRTNRRILERLRPMEVHEVGLARSIEGLVISARINAPALTITYDVTPDLEPLDDIAGETAYRTVQEGLTNVLQHAHARTVRVVVLRMDNELLIEVIDDGRGPASPPLVGRGLAGMRERAIALGGQFIFRREFNLTVVGCRIPVLQKARGDAPMGTADHGGAAKQVRSVGRTILVGKSTDA